MKLPNPPITHAPPRVPCTECHVSHGGCTARWMAWQEVCCETCNHQLVRERNN